MKQVRNKRELRCAYEVLQILSDLTGNPKKYSSQIVETKKAIRAYTQRPVDEARIVRNDGDHLVTVFPMPEWLQSKEEADEYFLDRCFLTCRPSMYDCTGQVFTTWYKIFKRQGRFWAYHATAMDV